MPLKWTAPEALLDLRYEANSDVYTLLNMIIFIFRFQCF